MAATVGSNNIKVSSVRGFSAGQEIILGTGPNSETAVISSVGTAGGTTLGNAARARETRILIANSQGFNAGQTITIGQGASSETAVVSSIAAARRRRGFGGGGFNGGMPLDTLIVTAPLTRTHIAGVQVAGTGITFKAALTRDQDAGTPVTAGIPTPGMPNKY
jgi:hypothetical protein